MAETGAKRARASGARASAQPQQAADKQPSMLLASGLDCFFQHLPAVPLCRLAQCCTQLRELSRDAGEIGCAIELHMRSLCQELPPAVAYVSGVPRITDAYRSAHAATTTPAGIRCWVQGTDTRRDAPSDTSS